MSTDERKARKAISGKAYYEKNKEILRLKNKAFRVANKDKIKAQNRTYYLANKDKIRAQNDAYYAEHKEHIDATRREWMTNNRERRRAWYKDWQAKHKKKNPSYKIYHNLLWRIGYEMKLATGNPSARKNKNVEAIIGCSMADFVKHLEARFSSGMNWENYGVWGWHVDHIIPCSHFDLTDEKQMAICFHYSNMQPLWRSDNISKGNKMPWELSA